MFLQALKPVASCVVSLTVLLFSAQAATAASAVSETVATEHAKARLIASHAPVATGAPFTLALEIAPLEGWHTYWENPGDSGLPTTMTWTLPEGFTASELTFPAPERILTEGIVNYGYNGTVTLFTTVTPPAQTSLANAEIKAHAEWLICHDICVPESADLRITLPLAADAKPSDEAGMLEQARAKLPAETEVRAAAAQNGDVVTLTIPSIGGASSGVQFFFPHETGLISNEKPQQWKRAQQGFTGTLMLAAGASLPAEWSGVLRFAEGVSYRLRVQSAAVPAPASSALPVQDNTDALTLGGALLFALLGGLILNVMPCVLPVLSFKALSLAGRGADQAGALRREGLAYTAGILVSFAALAAVLIGLKEAGDAVGWGYQLQSPLFVLGLAYLMLLIGLNLSGLFELPVLLGETAGDAERKGGIGGSFVTGVVATLVATPCTGPFMGAALGFTLTQPPASALLVFLTLGFGLALPYLLISFVPALARKLPKPGAWMEHFRHFLAFPMYATAAWLLWVLTQLAGPEGLAAAFTGALVLAFAGWAWRFVQWRSLPVKLFFLLAALMLAGLPGYYLREAREGCSLAAGDHVMASEVFSQARLAELRAAGKPVLVNATASWCITCKVNERLVLNTDAMHKAIVTRGITVLVADWTRRDASISAYLETFGRQGVPLYVYYPPSGEPRLLPQLLTQEGMLAAFDGRP